MANTTKQAAKQAIITQKDFNLIIRVLKANWWIPVIIIPIFFAMSVFYIYRLTSVYQVTTKILLQNNNAYYQSNVVTDAGFYGAQNYVDNSNEKRVILSYDLLDKVVTKLKDKLQVSYYIVGKVRTTEQFGIMPFLVKVDSINYELNEVPFDFRVIDNYNYEISYFKGDEKRIKKGKFGNILRDRDFKLSVIPNLDVTASPMGDLKNVYYQFIVHSNDFLIESISANASVDRKSVV